MPDPVTPVSTTPAAPVVQSTEANSVPAKEGGASADGGVAKVGAPEKYTDFTLPEGVKLEATEATELQTYAKTHNLTQEQAQALVDRTLKTRSDTEASVVAKQKESLVTLTKDWEAQTKADKDLGGENLTATIATAVKARDAFGSPELTKMLNDTGFGNHPEVVRFFAKVGKAMSEDKFVQGNAGVGAAANPDAARAARMYPSMATK